MQFSKVLPFLLIHLRWIMQRDSELFPFCSLCFTTLRVLAATEEDSIDGDCEESEERSTTYEFGNIGNGKIALPGP
jgi:hypothetical protein